MTLVVTIYHLAAWFKCSWKTSIIDLECPLKHELLGGVYRSAVPLKKENRICGSELGLKCRPVSHHASGKMYRSSSGESVRMERLHAASLL